MNRINIFAFILVAFVTFFSSPCLAAPSDDIGEMAREAFDKYMKDSQNRENLLRSHDFENEEEMDKAELGEKFRYMEFKGNVIQKDDAPYDPGLHVEGRINNWIFLVRVNGKAKTVFSIDIFRNKIRGCYITSNISTNTDRSARLAHDLDSLLSVWPASAGYQYRIIGNNEDPKTLHKGLSSLIELSRSAKILGFIPLTYINDVPEGSTKGWTFTATNLLDPDRFLAEMRSEARRIRELIEQHFRELSRAKK